jgi:sulfate transport system permease protein
MPRRRHALPGFRITLAFTLFYVGLIVVLPLLGLVTKATTLPWHGLVSLMSNPRTIAAFRVSFLTAGAAALINLPLGLLLAWTLTRYRFPGRAALDALVDLPFALPTAVAGIALTTLYLDDGWLGAPLASAGLTVAFTPIGIAVAMSFVGLPFVVRSIQPVLQALGRESEEVAMTLGASPGQIFRRVILPQLVPAALTGVGLAFARAVGEYGSVIFIAGNRPMVSEIVPLLIVSKLEQFDYPGAAALGSVMLGLSLAVLLGLGALQRRMAH